MRCWIARVKLGVNSFCSRYSTTSNVKTRFSVTNMQDQTEKQHGTHTTMLSEKRNQVVGQSISGDIQPVQEQRIGKNISATDKRKFLINTLFDLKDSKETVYGTLDAWVAWEHNFPLVALKRAMIALEKEHQWHRIVQVIKWMLSKGQGTTMGTYEQLIRALEKDNRAEEAHKIWVKKISHDLHSVPWRVCNLMISIYYRNNMLERLVKVFKGLESYDRIPPTKSIVQKVADAYEMLGLLEEKSRVVEKYSELFNSSSDGRLKKSWKFSRKKDKKTGKKDVTAIALEDTSVDSRPSDADIGGRV